MQGNTMTTSSKRKKPPAAWLFTTLPAYVNDISSDQNRQMVMFTDICTLLGQSRFALLPTMKRYFPQMDFLKPETRKSGRTEVCWKIDYFRLRLEEIWNTYPNEVKKHQMRTRKIA